MAAEETHEEDTDPKIKEGEEKDISEIDKENPSYQPEVEEFVTEEP
jgi:hypothetical protein